MLDKTFSVSNNSELKQVLDDNMGDIMITLLLEEENDYLIEGFDFYENDTCINVVDKTGKSRVLVIDCVLSGCNFVGLKKLKIKDCTNWFSDPYRDTTVKPTRSIKDCTNWFSDSSETFVRIERCEDATVENYKYEGQEPSYVGVSNSGLVLYNSKCNVLNSVFNNFECGIVLVEGSKVELSNCVISGGKYGIYVYDECEYNTSNVKFENVEERIVEKNSG